MNATVVPSGDTSHWRNPVGGRHHCQPPVIGRPHVGPPRVGDAPVLVDTHPPRRSTFPPRSERSSTHRTGAPRSPPAPPRLPSPGWSYSADMHDRSFQLLGLGARALGLTFGRFARPRACTTRSPTFPGVRVGHVTVWADDERGIARTGVTAIVPDGVRSMFERPMAAGHGRAQRRGRAHRVGRVAGVGHSRDPDPPHRHHVGRARLRRAGRRGDRRRHRRTRDPVIGECDDSWLDDLRRRSLTVAHARRAARRGDRRTGGRGL